MATTTSLLNFSDRSSQKLNILQQTGAVNNNNKVNVIENEKRNIIIFRKQVKYTGAEAVNKPRKNKAGREMSRVQNPPPVAVARRNARERNRVKQVNNGFATLRQHIPTAIAASYESGTGSGGRGTNKKLSKVETLRMAVEYIKSLENLLDLSTSHDSSSEQTTYTSPTSYPYTVTATEVQPDDLFISRLQKKVPLKSNFQLLYEHDENIHPDTMDELDDELLSNPNLELHGHDDLSMFHSIDNASLSPEVYSEHSMSPTALDPDTKSCISVFNLPNAQNILPSFTHIAYERLPQIKSELLSPNTTAIDKEEMQSTSDLCVNHSNELIQNQNIIHTIWWGPESARS